MRGEPEEERFSGVLQTGYRLIGWPTILETRIVIVRQAPDRMIWLDRFLKDDKTIAVSFDGELEQSATIAFQRFGKGRHPASLNFGDCMTYAVARARNLPLLFKGDDFSRTDVDIHPASAFSR